MSEKNRLLADKLQKFFLNYEYRRVHPPRTIEEFNTSETLALEEYLHDPQIYRLINTLTDHVLSIIEESDHEAKR